jgi:hypothetical protein
LNTCVIPTFLPKIAFTPKPPQEDCYPGQHAPLPIGRHNFGGESCFILSLLLSSIVPCRLIA